MFRNLNLISMYDSLDVAVQGHLTEGVWSSCLYYAAAAEGYFWIILPPHHWVRSLILVGGWVGVIYRDSGGKIEGPIFGFSFIDFGPIKKKNSSFLVPSVQLIWPWLNPLTFERELKYNVFIHVFVLSSWWIAAVDHIRNMNHSYLKIIFLLNISID